MDPNHLDQVLKAPPQWAMTLGLLGKGLVFGAFIAFLVSVFFYCRNNTKAGRLALNVGVVELFGVMGALAVLLQTHQYQFAYVYSHSDSHVTPQYLVASLWAGQQGSFLLWAVTSGIFAMLVMRRAGKYERWMAVPYGVFLASLAAILAYESPFAIQLVENRLLMPPDGGGLEPSLMNYWFLIHPPTMFMGFGSLTVLYCWAMSALINRDTDSWIKALRPWVLVSATLMGTGLAMGGFWAYETLGWGGFWAWDPVENVSFVSWVWVLALAHGIFLQVARNQFRIGNLWLAGTSMVSFCYGTFLTRSGLMGNTSVHSFANMDRTALKILVGVMIASLIAFTGVYMKFKPTPDEPKPLKPAGPFQLEWLYNLGVWLLMAFAACGLVGMTTPVASQMLSAKQTTIEPHIFNRITVWFFVPLALAMTIAPFVSWRGIGAKALWKRLEFAVGGSLFFAGLILIWYKRIPPDFQLGPDERLNTLFGFSLPTVGVVMVLSWICLLGICANVVRIAETWKTSRKGAGSFISHVGILTGLLGLIFSRGLENSHRENLQRGITKSFLGYEVSFDQDFEKNLDRENVVPMEFKSPSGSFTAHPVHYFRDPNPDEPQSVFRPDIMRRGLYDLYVTLGTVQVKDGEANLDVGKTLTITEDENKNAVESITYQGLRREGEAGKAGTTFYADMVYNDKNGPVKVSPGLKLGGAGGPDMIGATAGPYVYALKSMDAATKSVDLDVFYKSPLYPVEVFFKPMTILVWLGIGIMALGGFWAAAYRRTSHAPRPVETDSEQKESEYTDREKDASVATA